MSVVGVPAGSVGQADDRVAMDADKPFGLSDATAIVQVSQDGVCLLVGKPTVKKGCAFALGEAGLAGVAVEQTDVVVLAVACTDREVAGTASSVERTVERVAAEASEVVHGRESSREEEPIRSQ